MTSESERLRQVAERACLHALNAELLAALKGLFEVVTEREQGNHDLDEELDAASAAIAKAEKEKAAKEWSWAGTY